MATSNTVVLSPPLFPVMILPLKTMAAAAPARPAALHAPPPPTRTSVENISGVATDTAFHAPTDAAEKAQLDATSPATLLTCELQAAAPRHAALVPIAIIAKVVRPTKSRLRRLTKFPGNCEAANNMALP
mmetsp:Transcript_20453/g.40915  ORF Transcript_20453/g.40915 Transcript_20453/m.40915 type:complete len:130 (+) Transcript_20453:247-636(+)|eukprot:CAMPEP_0194328936 /NCGR_PEP_ID=MMETSP0171-20130528/46465_1 /TAXON_ID=218684 /ORGANISM="Corethron pennatum, Strain L29A3" /LENGTH=129 /DNA_ID=CAMNT_0039089477 /DNA_START=244 /DNA_END=633 /DNA_ORIENTATION=+